MSPSKEDIASSVFEGGGAISSSTFSHKSEQAEIEPAHGPLFDILVVWLTALHDLLIMYMVALDHYSAV
jgi:hypothetical protein